MVRLEPGKETTKFFNLGGSRDHELNPTADRPTLCILPYHGLGHYSAVYGLARHLQITYDVFFAGPDYFATDVTEKGFPFLSLATYPFGIGLETWIHKVNKSPVYGIRAGIDRWRDQMYQDRVAELTRVAQDFKPDVWLVDAQQATDLIVLKAIDPQSRIIIFHTSSPYILLPGFPPANSSVLPTDERRVQAACQKTKETIDADVWRQRFKFFAPDDRTIVDRRLALNQMLGWKSDFPSLLSFAAKGVEQWILTYEKLDFGQRWPAEFSYRGYWPDPFPEKRGVDLARTVIARARSIGRKLIYLSLGTVPSSRNFRPFLRRVCEAVARLNCFIVISTKKRFSNVDPERVMVVDWVAQRELLPACAAFITHGGINSVHHAIAARVPMLVYPVNPHFDQRGNAARVVHHGIGLRGDLYLDSTDDIFEKLTKLLNESAAMKERMARLVV